MYRYWRRAARASRGFKMALFIEPSKSNALYQVPFFFLIVRSGKSKAQVTNNKRLRSRYCAVEAITTDRHEASRGVSATCLIFY